MCIRDRLAHCELWNKEYLRRAIEAQSGEMKVATRTRFYHRKKKPDLQILLKKFQALRKAKAGLHKVGEEPEDSEEKLPSPAPLQPLKTSTQSSLKQLAQKEDDAKSHGEETWVWVILEGSLSGDKSFGAGIKLVFPAGISLQLWRRLSYAGAKALGLCEQISVLHEASRFVYPNDFPFTPAYEEQKKAEGFELAIGHYRKPPSKRVNYQKTGFAYPFISLWEEIVPEGVKIAPLQKEGVCPVEIAMGKRYVPKERGIICIRIAKVRLCLNC
eukprot:TRINITY_DN65_c0_g1_i3.p2 TRINITY_DN65_c0_g1~~TRINITY_DN65_c0_g1_i3.p2  ORF type:complete len:272 (+),score=66.65 TRINITY_DN65_c0_g1_i3:71-886(+)